MTWRLVSTLLTANNPLMFSWSAYLVLLTCRGELDYNFENIRLH
jgi:hypothetical protein